MAADPDVTSSRHTSADARPPRTLHRDRYLASIARDTDRIATIGAVDFTRRVPSCPNWEMGDLITHVGWFAKWAAYIAELPDGAHGENVIEWATPRLEDGRWRPDEAQAETWFRDAAENLVRALDETPPDRTINSFYGSHHPDLLMRRAATEIAIHRWDAEGVEATSFALDPALAADAIDEFLDLLVPLFFRYDEFASTGETIRLQSTDDTNAWTITAHAGRTDWRPARRDAPVDATVTGSRSDLYLFCWGRSPVEPLVIHGDARLLARWQAAAAF